MYDELLTEKPFLNSSFIMYDELLAWEPSLNSSFIMYDELNSSYTILFHNIGDEFASGRFTARKSKAGVLLSVTLPLPAPSVLRSSGWRDIHP